MNISQQELQEIKDRFKAVLRYSQNVDDPQIDELFENWLTSKEVLFDNVLGKQLIKEFPDEVLFTLSPESRESNFRDFLYKVGSKGLDNLCDFLESQKDNFYDNIVNTDYEYSNIVIKKGSKIIKAFKHFIINDSLCKQLQDEASILIQDNKITGTFCISIHPLDYLSSSENCHKWRSCHALDGEYRAGNLSYMTDECTTVCYIKTTNSKVKLPNFPPDVLWNDKKWRMLLYFPNVTDKNFVHYGEVFAGRQYPRRLEGVLEYIKENALPAGYWCDWTNKKLTTFPENC